LGASPTRSPTRTVTMSMSASPEGIRRTTTLTAALGAFVFRVVVASVVAPVVAPPNLPTGSAGFRVRITEIGVYIRDSFDFEGSQVLGCWSDEPPPQFSPLMPPAVGGGGLVTSMPSNMILTPVGNLAFREWRQRNSRGGDFLVFSEMKRVSLNPPDEFMI
jgi:hypothetical protein